ANANLGAKRPGAEHVLATVAVRTPVRFLYLPNRGYRNHPRAITALHAYAGSFAVPAVEDESLLSLGEWGGLPDGRLAGGTMPEKLVARLWDVISEQKVVRGGDGKEGKARELVKYLRDLKSGEDRLEFGLEAALQSPVLFRRSLLNE